MTAPEEKYTEDEIFQVLINLVDEGKLISSCGKCKMPIDFKELVARKCNTCGVLSQNDILFISIDKVVMN